MKFGVICPVSERGWSCRSPLRTALVAVCNSQRKIPCPSLLDSFLLFFLKNINGLTFYRVLGLSFFKFHLLYDILFTVRYFINGFITDLISPD